MSTERDELADELADSIFRYTGVTTSSSKSMAEELLAAGYRKPQQVTTAFALEEMPKGTLILAANGEVWRKYTHKWDNLDETGDLIYPPHHITLPATVLHVGGAE